MTTEAGRGEIRVGVIGGSGLYEMEGLTIIAETKVDTPYGDPSDAIMIGDIAGHRVAFLARHGRGHRLLPVEINFRANIWAMKSLGVETIISASAVGSLKEQYRPTDIVMPHQFIDRTRHRVDTYFGDGIVAHVSMADPICSGVAFVLGQTGREKGATTHIGGTYVCIEGPQFSTRAESHLYRSWGADVIGMTNLHEARLAREAEICYASMALVTDYDAWHEEEEPVTVEQVIAYLRQNASTASEIIRSVIPLIATRRRDCVCVDALRFAILTPLDQVSERRKQQLAPILNKYLEPA